MDFQNVSVEAMFSLLRLGIYKDYNGHVVNTFN